MRNIIVALLLSATVLTNNHSASAATPTQEIRASLLTAKLYIKNGEVKAAREVLAATQEYIATLDNPQTAESLMGATTSAFRDVLELEEKSAGARSVHRTFLN
jgi:hypothetical protein